MRITHLEATVTGPTGKSATLELLLDSGMMYSLLPQHVWQ